MGKNADQHIDCMVLPVHMPLPPAVISADNPVPDWVSALTGPNCLSLGGK